MVSAGTVNREPLRILLASIIEPALQRGGAGTVTRTLVKLLQGEPLQASIEIVAAPSARRRLHRGRQVASLVRSLISGRPAKAEFTYSAAFRRSVRRAAHEPGLDLVILNGSDLLWLLAELPPALPRFLVAHNIEHQLYRSQIDCTNPPTRILRNLLWRDCARLRDYEMEGIGQVGNVLFLSHADADCARREHAKIATLTIPPLFDYPPAERARGKATATPDGIDIGFMGNCEWWPNQEGLRWFLQRVFPYTGASTRLHLFGEKSERLVADHPRIGKHGFVPALRQVWETCDFMICPVFSGGGVSVKLAEALYNGMPVLATSFATRGLPMCHDPSLVVLDSVENWIEFLRSPAARRLAERRQSTLPDPTFAASTHAAPLHTFIRSVMERARRSG